MSLSRLKWLTAIAVSAFLLAFEYVRHVLFPQLLHSWPIYVLSIAGVFVFVLLFNELVFSAFSRIQDENARLNAEVKDKANYLNAVIESSGNAIITVSRDGRIQSWNRAAEAIYGWKKEEVVGKSFPMVPADLLDDAERIAARLWNGETIRNFETQRVRKSGEVIPVMLTASPIRDSDSNVVSVLGISTDLRERKRLEQELLQQQRVLATVQERERLARELHDSLGQVLGFVNTQSQAVRELLARGQIDRAQACLKDLIEVAQDAHADVREYILGLQSGAIREQPFLFALRDYVRRFSSTTGIQTELVVPESLESCTFDPTIEAQLMRIIQEAMTNARRHANAEHVRIAFEQDDGSMRVEISDDGKGFEMSRMINDEGRHFGMRIMRERAADFGGRVDVDSEVGKGTHVVVHVPIREEKSRAGIAG